jgi:CPA2 family monovalent cation:H+ antiporter-2
MFTLAVLALVFLIATGSAVIFDTSVPLGAFIAGMIIGKTSVRHQAAAHALPLTDIFSILFFLSIGMLFNPVVVITHYPFFLGILVVIMLIKPLSAYLITICMGYSKQIAMTLAIALAQIGEFSFILAEEGSRVKLLPDEGYDIIVACAIISILLNPILFSSIQKKRITPDLTP